MSDDLFDLTAPADPRATVGTLYGAADEPTLVEVPPLRCLMVDGEGDPNGPGYADAVGTLYAVSYRLRALAKEAGLTPWRVMPLEALWWAHDLAAFRDEDRAAWQWTALIVQPGVVNDAAVASAVTVARQKGKAPSADALRFALLDEGQAMQVMHRGPYSAEAPTIDALHMAIGERGLTLRGAHHEVYLSDPRRVAPEKMRTIIRQPVAPA